MSAMMACFFMDGKRCAARSMARYSASTCAGLLADMPAGLANSASLAARPRRRTPTAAACRLLLPAACRCRRLLPGVCAYLPAPAARSCCCLSWQALSAWTSAAGEWARFAQCRDEPQGRRRRPHRSAPQRQRDLQAGPGAAAPTPHPSGTWSSCGRCLPGTPAAHGGRERARREAQARPQPTSAQPWQARASSAAGRAPHPLLVAQPALGGRTSSRV